MRPRNEGANPFVTISAKKRCIGGRAWIGRFRELRSSPGDERLAFLTLNELYSARVLEIAPNAVTKPLAACGTFTSPVMSSLFPILDP
jgi:hypothetical protein